MQCLVVYDIPEDRLRAKVADICLDYGLLRVQYSAFAGDLPRTYQEELLLKIKKRAGKKEVNVYVLALCERCWAKRLTWIQKASRKADG